MNGTAALSFTALIQRAHPALLRNLTPDPEQARHAPSVTAGQVKSGHCVEVRPTSLPAPRYVIHSQAFFQALGLAEEVASDPTFMQLLPVLITPAIPCRRVASSAGLRRVSAGCPLHRSRCESGR